MNKKHKFAIGFIGFAGSGKTTAANFMNNLLRNRYKLPTVSYSFAEPLYKAAAGMFYEPLHYWTDQTRRDEVVINGKTRREILQLLGTEFGRRYLNRPSTEEHAYESPWTTMARKWKDKYVDVGSIIVYDNVRFHDEITFLHQDFTYSLLIHIKRPGVDAVNNHSSEDLASGPIPYLRGFPHSIINNDGDFNNLKSRCEAMAYLVTKLLGHHD